MMLASVVALLCACMRSAVAQEGRVPTVREAAQHLDRAEQLAWMTLDLTLYELMPASNTRNRGYRIPVRARNTCVILLLTTV